MPTGFVDRIKGKNVIATEYQAQGGAFFASWQDNITATPTGSQSTSLLLTQQNNRITTVTTTGDGVRLPPAIPGAAIVVLNDAAVNPCNVWPSSATQGGIAGGDKINTGAANAAFSLAASAGAAGGPVIFYVFSAGTWRTK
jgi:hypothetical protein